MRSAGTLILALVLSFLVAGVVQVQTAVWLDMDEEFIISLTVLPVFCLVVTVALGLALGLAETPGAVDRIAAGFAILTALAGAGLVLWSVVDGRVAALRAAMPILGTILVPCLIVVLIQWWLVRRRVVRRGQQTIS